MDHPTDQTLEEISGALRGNDFSKFLDDLPRKSDLTKQLQNENLSADSKIWLEKIMEITINVGTSVVSIGRKILATVFNVVKTFPGTSFGIVIGAVLSLLIGGIPIIGVLLGPILSPLLLAFGIGMGSISDFMSGSFRNQMLVIESEFSILKV